MANACPSDLHAVRRRRELHPLMTRQFQRFCRLSRRVWRPLPDTNRPGYVLYSLIAHVAEGYLDPIGDCLVHNIGDAHAPRLGKTFKPRGNVDAVPENVSVLEDNVP